MGVRTGEDSCGTNLPRSEILGKQSQHSILAEGRQGHHESTLNSTCLILKYHRIAQLSYDPMQLAVQAHIFEEQMEYLSQNFNVISLNDLREHTETSRPFEKNSIAVTFDVGYSDVLHTAKEILERFSIPATVFTATANIDKGKEFWWDQLENYLIANRSEQQLEIEIEDRNYCWSLKTRRERFQAYDELYSMMCYIPANEQMAIMEQIAQNLKLDAEKLDSHRTMDAKELKQLEEGELISIGGHTHNCVDLSLLPKRIQAAEISKNKQVLEEITGRSVDYFSYPFNTDNPYMAETVGILKGAGFKLACGNSSGPADLTRGARLFNLPRVKVGNWNAFAFYRFLESFFEN